MISLVTGGRLPSPVAMLLAGAAVQQDCLQPVLVYETCQVLPDRLMNCCIARQVLCPAHQDACHSEQAVAGSLSSRPLLRLKRAAHISQCRTVPSQSIVHGTVWDTTAARELHAHKHVSYLCLSCSKTFSW